MGDGSFQIKILKRKEREEVRVVIQIDQKEEEILREIKEEIGGNMYYRGKQGTYYYSSTSIRVAKKWVKYLDENQMVGGKYNQYVLWRRVLVMMERKEHKSEKGIEKIRGIKERITKMKKGKIEVEEKE